MARIINRLKTYNKKFDLLDELRIIVSQMLEEINNETHSIALKTPNYRFKRGKEYLNKESNYEGLEDYFDFDSFY